MRRTHGLSNSPTYACWEKMIQRCTNPRDPKYRRYGERGITVCERWLKFENFLDDMGAIPTGLTLDRRRNNEGYGPDNCEWATRQRQNRNRSTSLMLTIGSRTQCLIDWCEEYGANRKTVLARIRLQGMSIEEALTKPTRRKEAA